MSRWFPKGSVSRQRRDWNLEGLWYGSINTAGSGSGYSQASLNNTAQYGEFLAIYGILAWTSVRPNLCAFQVRQRLQSGGIPLYTPMYPGATMIAGSVASIISIDATLNTGAPFFRADGTWFAFPDGQPLQIIQPGQQLVVWTTGPFFTNDITGTQLTCTFLWGVY